MVLRRRLAAAALAAALLVPGTAAAGSDAALPFPIQADARFALTDQFGRAVTEADYAGGAMLIFFGYTQCRSTCPVALPTMAATLDLLGPDAAALTALMITVDPANDTPEAMRAALAELHPDLIGLTGSQADLAAVRERFGVETELLFIDRDGLPVYAHGTFIYLIAADGRLLSLLPPVLSPERIAELIRRHLGLGTSSGEGG